MESVFTLHRTIAERVLQELDLRLAAPERVALEENPTSSPQAWEFFQQGKATDLSGATMEINLRAAELYERAIAEDSTFALAYVRLAAVLFFTGREEEMPRGLEAMGRAREINPDLLDLRHAQGALLWARRQWEEAIGEYRAILRARPSDTEALQYLGVHTGRLGRWDEALEAFERAYELAPLYPNVAWNLAVHHLLLRNYEKAQTFLDRYAELAPEEGLLLAAREKAWIRLVAYGDVAGAEQVLRGAEEALGSVAVLRALTRTEVPRFWFGLPGWSFRADLREHSISDLGANPSAFFIARAVSEMAEGNDPGAQAYFDSALVAEEEWLRQDPDGTSWIGLPLAALGQREDAVRATERRLELQPLWSDAYNRGPSALMFSARVWVMLGDHDRAVDALDTLLAIPSWWSATWLTLHPIWDPLRDHPRFQALLEEYADDVEH